MFAIQSIIFGMVIPALIAMAIVTMRDSVTLGRKKTQKHRERNASWDTCKQAK
jgi:hypothetical protein